MTDLETRITKLENTLAFLKGGAAVLVFAILVFFGLSSFVQIPNAVQDRIQETIPGRVDKAFEDAFPKIEDQLSDLLARTSNSASQAKANEEELGALTSEYSTRLTQWETQLSRLSSTFDERVGGWEQEVDALSSTFDERVGGWEQEVDALSSTFDERIGGWEQEVDALSSTFDERVGGWEKRVDEERVHFLGKVDCGVRTDVRVPVEGTKTNDWIVFGINPNFRVRERGNYGDDAIFSFETRIVEEKDEQSWIVWYNIYINSATANRVRRLLDCRSERVNSNTTMEFVALRRASRPN